MEKKKDEKVTFRVYDMRPEVIKGLYAYAKIHCNNSIAEAITEAWEMLKENEEQLHTAIPQKLIELETRIEALEKKPEEVEDDSIKTMGGNKVGKE